MRTPVAIKPRPVTSDGRAWEVPHGVLDVITNIQLIGGKGEATLTVGGADVCTEEIITDYEAHCFAPWEPHLPICLLHYHKVKLTTMSGCKAIEVHGYRTTEVVAPEFTVAGKRWIAANGALSARDDGP